MTERESSRRHDSEPTVEKGIDREVLFAKLVSPELVEKFDFEVSEEDLAWAAEELLTDDNVELMEWLASLAIANGADHDEFFAWLGIETEPETE
ncbi:MAG TPA: hypothetical protein VFS14_01295 [Candidatus Saccharimonadales bacterium]|nr:hypothetical protein [Candidatus Saccharimonadales bacterium]